MQSSLGMFVVTEDREKKTRERGEGRREGSGERRVLWRLWRDITRGRPSAPGKTAGWSPAARADRDGASGVDSSFRLTAQGPDGLAGVTQLCKIALYGICIDTQ